MSSDAGARDPAHGAGSSADDDSASPAVDAGSETPTIPAPSAPDARAPGADAASVSEDDAVTPADASAGDAGEPPACGAGESLGPNGSCFVILTPLVAWADARLACQALGTGWDLAAIRDPTLNEYLGTLASNEAWIGASDADEEGTWTWVRDGAVFWIGDGETGSTADGAYASWNSDEPNGGGTSDCARFVPATSTWADLECSSLRGAACERGAP